MKSGIGCSSIFVKVHIALAIISINLSCLNRSILSNIPNLNYLIGLLVSQPDRKACLLLVAIAVEKPL